MSVLLHPAILSSENFISSTSIYSIQVCTTFDQMFFSEIGRYQKHGGINHGAEHASGSYHAIQS